jgi:hypothetical protein
MGGPRNVSQGKIIQGKLKDCKEIGSKSQPALCEQLQRRTPLDVGRPYTRIPQELWRIIVDYLPSLTGRYAAEVFGFQLQDQHQRHSNIWNKIFETKEWTSTVTELDFNPFLVGDGLHNLYNDPDQPAYIALLTGDKSGKLGHCKESLISSLRPHTRNEKDEIVFHDSKIILNITDALYSTFFTVLTPKRLFSCYDDNKLRTACLYWQDEEYALRTVESNSIVGAGGRASSLDTVSFICGISLPHPKEMGVLHRRQYCFQHPTCPTVHAHLPEGRRYNGRNILGWELDQNHLA